MKSRSNLVFIMPLNKKSYPIMIHTSKFSSVFEIDEVYYSNKLSDYNYGMTLPEIETETSSIISYNVKPPITRKGISISFILRECFDFILYCSILFTESLVFFIFYFTMCCL